VKYFVNLKYNDGIKLPYYIVTGLKLSGSGPVADVHTIESPKSLFYECFKFLGPHRKKQQHLKERNSLKLYPNSGVYRGYVKVSKLPQPYIYMYKFWTYYCVR